MKTRILKVYECLHNNYYPKIIFQGRWLLNADFHAGDKIKIEIQRKQLVISVIDQEVPNNSKQLNS